MFIDTDIGTDIDDSLALALAARSPEIELTGVTTVTGDTALRARIARKILSLAGKDDVPVAAGCGTNLMQTKFHLTQGNEGKGILDTDSDGLPYHAGHAVDFMIEQIKKTSGKTTLVTIGPVTNVALAILKEPDIIKHIEKLVVMGGCVYPEWLSQQSGVPLEITPRMEYNLCTDPEAAEIVFKAGMPTVLVPVEVTLQTWLNNDEQTRLRNFGSTLTQKLIAAIDIWIPLIRKIMVGYGMPGEFARPYLHDPLTVAVAFERRFVKLEPMHIRVAQIGKMLRTLKEPDKKPNMEVAVSVDADAFRAFFMDRICKA